MSIWDKDRRNDSNDKEESFSPTTYSAPRPITASAAKLDLKNKREIEGISERRQTDKWQEEAWDYYDLIPEIKHSANLVANVLSRINVYAAYVTDSASVPAKIDAMEDIDEDLKERSNSALYMLESGNGGTSGLLRDAALNLFVVGECYLVKEPGRFSTGVMDKYQIRSIDEVVSTKVNRKNSVAIKPRRDSKATDLIPLPENGYIARMWKNHPRYGDEADSSLRGLLDICDSLLLLDRTTSATAKSRLNAGMLFVPDGLSNMSQSDSDLTEEGEESVEIATDETDSFEEELITAMVTPIADESSASAVVPLLVRGPEELGEKIRFIQFQRAFDPMHVQMAAEKLDRILAGLDIPKDVAKGLSGVKYSNAILIEEQLYKAHIEPLILMIVDCLTVGFLRPALLAQGFPPEQVARTVVWYDPSNITAKPSKAEAAVTLYEKGAISLEALRRSNGFSDSDAPTPLETAQRFAKERGMLNDAITEKLVSTLIPQEILESMRKEQLAQSDPESANALDDALNPDVPNMTPADRQEENEEDDYTEIKSPPNLLEP